MKQEKTSGISEEWPSIEIFDYSVDTCNIFFWDFLSSPRLNSLADIADGHVRWINVDGPCSEGLLNEIGSVFHIHPLAIHNLRNQFQRAKVEEYDGFLSIVTKMIYFTDDILTVEHTNILLGHNYVLTFGDTKGDVFENIRRRIQADMRVRSAGADHLAYLLLDAIVDGYFDALETIGGQIDDLEDSIMEKTTKQHLLQIRTIKKDLLRVNRHIWPLRNVASLMDKESSELIHPETEPYLRDVYNHIVQAIDSTETYRDLLSGLADLHFSNISYRMNEIMKVLTIISTIFIPLTFIVGVYGMNFKYMPELNQPWGYPAIWVVMVAVSIVMLLFFRKKKWL
ncbi:magnesium/cobalt transporter CorA [Faecalispora anaeroviscerum]|uniref:magnesium/cobalt transporter CorA n=1 Tax=Faecalispora anaeroviscerum TaxID=2991836 RepID=UPI0024BB776F|nr:magnesium/cobalt transporter CorA [Faecalispora anaeroviscerum]